MAVQELRKVIEVLTVEPAEFYEVLVPLVSILEKEIKSENILKAVVEVLLEKVCQCKKNVLVHRILFSTVLYILA